MKKIVITLAAIMILGSGIRWILVSYGPSYFGGKKTVYIAVVGPMSGAKKATGEAMLRGIRLYLEHIQETGQLREIQVEILERNDFDDAQKAAKVASEIVLGREAVLVLGHYSSQPSLAAGEIYQKAGLPVITASATAEAVTHKNTWYFRTVPNNRIQAIFAANYIKNVLNQNSVSLVFDDDTYGMSLAENFTNTARNIGLSISKTQGFDATSDGLDETLRKIMTELRAMQEQSTIFFATHSTEAVKIITSIKYPGTTYTIVGPDSFSTKTFIDGFKFYGQEKFLPGYYSDDIYVISPFLIDIGNPNAQKFRQAFIKKYHEEPTWVSACYYDAMALAVEVVERAEVEGSKENIRTDRIRIQEVLAGLSDPDVAMPGITGDIYFDEFGDVNWLPAVGSYQKQKISPAFSQYQTLLESTPQLKGISQVLPGKFAQIGELFIRETQIVYTGIDINEISNLDLKNGTCTVDFYVWFRFQEDFKDPLLLFSTAVHPITLGQPILQNKNGDITTRAYHVKADFHNDFDFHAYPFDQQRIRIKFHHQVRPRTSLIYVRDDLGLSPLFEKQHIGGSTINAISGWEISDIVSHQDSAERRIRMSSGDEGTLLYSQFNTDIHIQREGVSFVGKTFFPILALVTMIYCIYFIPSEKIGVRMLVAGASLVATAGYHARLRLDFQVDYMLAIEYAFFTVYILVVMALAISYIVRKHKTREKTVYVLSLTGKVLHPLLVLMAGLFFVYRIL